MFIGVVIPADLQAPVYTAPFNGLSDLQSVVDGFVEAIDLPGHLAGTIWCDEEGKLKGKNINWRATALVLMKNREYLVADDLVREVIVGDCLVSGRSDDEGETTDVGALIQGLVQDLSHDLSLQIKGEQWVEVPISFPNCLTAIGQGVRARSKHKNITAVKVFPTGTEPPPE